MAVIAHLGVGLAAKRVAPKANVGVLILGAYAIDIIFGAFYFAGIEHMPGPNPVTTNPWSHGLFMALVWSLSLGLIALAISHSRRAAIIAGLLVFSHWVIDFISHPMTGAYPDDTRLSLFFDGSPTVGLGLWSNDLNIAIGEYGTLAIGLVIYIITVIQLRQKRKATKGNA